MALIGSRRLMLLKTKTSVSLWMEHWSKQTQKPIRKQMLGSYSITVDPKQEPVPISTSSIEDDGEEEEEEEEEEDPAPER